MGKGPINFVDPLGLYKLKNFPPAQAADMKNAMDQAISKLRACPSCAGEDGPKIANTIEHTTFVYVSDLRSKPIRMGGEDYPAAPICGDSGEKSPPAKPTHVILIGGLNWDHPNQCHCGLPSLIAHEASHKPPTSYDHTQTDKLEKQCFGCDAKSAPNF